MTYRICYDDGPFTGVSGREGVTRTEHYHSEVQALARARELLEDADHDAVAVYDHSGKILGGIRLQLKLGMQAMD